MLCFSFEILAATAAAVGNLLFVAVVNATATAAAVGNLLFILIVAVVNATATHVDSFEVR